MIDATNITLDFRVTDGRATVTWGESFWNERFLIFEMRRDTIHIIMMALDFNFLNFQSVVLYSTSIQEGIKL